MPEWLIFVGSYIWCYIYCGYFATAFVLLSWENFNKVYASMYYIWHIILFPDANQMVTQCFCIGAGLMFNMLAKQHGPARPSIVQHGPTGPAWSSTHNGDQRNLVPQTDVQQQKRDIVMSTKLRIVAKSVLFRNVGMRWIVCLSVVPLVWSNMQR